MVRVKQTARKERRRTVQPTAAPLPEVMRRLRTRYADALVQRWVQLDSSSQQRDHDKGNDKQGDIEEEEPTYLTCWLARDLQLGTCSKCGDQVEESMLPRHQRMYGLCVLTSDWQDGTATLNSLVTTPLTTETVEDWALRWYDTNDMVLGGAEVDATSFPQKASKVALFPSYTTAHAAFVQTTSSTVCGGRYSRDEQVQVLYSPQEVWAWHYRKYHTQSRNQTDDSVAKGEAPIYKKNWLERSKLTPKLRLPKGGLNPHLLALLDDNDTAKTNAPHPQRTFQQHGGINCDVWSTACLHLVPTVKVTLDDWAARTADRPIPRYQMIIDPNLFTRIRHFDGQRVWVPSEFEVSADGRVRLVGADTEHATSRAHYIDADIINTTATPVLQQALPLLARLKRPALLLEDQRLQVVIKAQRIEVPEQRLGEQSATVNTSRSWPLFSFTIMSTSRSRGETWNSSIEDPWVPCLMEKRSNRNGKISDPCCDRHPENTTAKDSHLFPIAKFPSRREPCWFFQIIKWRIGYSKW